MAKFTEADVKELAALLHKNSGGVAFLTGAGCSISAGIPPAPKLVEQINKEYPDTVRHLEESKRSDYGACMGILSLAEREELIKPYLENAKINWAHIALATLIEKKFVSRVLTFNFDSVLAHACGLLGIYPATYDFGISPSDRTDYLAQPCIVHLHGQGYGPVMMNSDEETQEHAEKLSPLLTHTLDKYPLIVVGYSGEADQVFEKLISLYTGRHRLYWLGYSEEPKAHLRAFLNGKHRKLVHYIGGADADQFLIQLAQQLNCFPPLVFANPAGHLLAEMKDIAPYPLNDAEQTDILKNTVERLKTHQTALKFTPNQTAVLSNKPNNIDANDKNIPPEIQAWALIQRGNEQLEAPFKINSVSEYEKSAQHFEAALKIKPDMPEALLGWGEALSRIAQLKKEPALHKAGFEKFEAALRIKPRYHLALSNWGNAIANLAELKQDPVLFEEGFAKFEDAFRIKSDDHLALSNWGGALLNLAKLEKNPALFETSFAKFEAALYVKPDYHKALQVWGIALLNAWNIFKEQKYLNQATEIISRAEMLKPDTCYDGACLASVKNDEEGCKERLFRANSAKTLPSRQHVENDEDLANMRDKPWFAELLKGL